MTGAWSCETMAFMGWDIVKYAGRTEMLHDLQLWTIRHFCLTAADSLLEDSARDCLLSEARDFFAAWDWIAPGVVAGIGFDRFVGDNSQREATLVRVLERAAARVRAFGPVVPLTYLEAHVNEPGAGYTGPQSSRALVRSIARLRGLLLARHAESTPKQQ